MKEHFDLYEVGGHVRDSLLGIESKDIDFVAVPNETLLNLHSDAQKMFECLIDYLKQEKYDLFLIKDDCYTIRAMFPKGHQYTGVADFVMARKEVGYIKGTRQPIIEPGTLYDDLSRRESTLNALAKDKDGTIIDFFNGIQDLKDKILRTPLDPIVTFDDDPLRLLRAIRFKITKGFDFVSEIHTILETYDYETKMGVVSGERIYDELMKCFKFDVLSTLKVLEEYPRLRDYIFTKTKLWLKPTFEKK